MELEYKFAVVGWFYTFKSSLFHIKSKRNSRIRKQKRRLYVRKKVKKKIIMEQDDDDEKKEETNFKSELLELEWRTDN